MVESPTYYHSLSPILKSLKEFDMENFPLQKEIVYTKASKKLPEYLREATFDTSVVFHENPTDDDSEGIYYNESSENSDHADDHGLQILPEYLNKATFDESAVSREKRVEHGSKGSYSRKYSEKSDDNDNSEYKLGSVKSFVERIDVRQFFKVFKKSKNTLLEKSQRRALVQALKNRIGIIQGEKETIVEMPCYTNNENTTQFNW